MVDRSDPAIPCVLVLDESSLERLLLPLANPERVVLISQQNPRLLARAWDASIVSVVSRDDSLPTVLLAIMAAALRVGKIASLHRFKCQFPQVDISLCVNNPRRSEFQIQTL